MDEDYKRPANLRIVQKDNWFDEQDLDGWYFEITDDTKSYFQGDNPRQPDFTYVTLEFLRCIESSVESTDVDSVEGESLDDETSYNDTSEEQLSQCASEEEFALFLEEYQFMMAAEMKYIDLRKINATQTDDERV